VLLVNNLEVVDLKDEFGVEEDVEHEEKKADKALKKVAGVLKTGVGNVKAAYAKTQTKENKKKVNAAFSRTSNLLKYLGGGMR